jgi:hypothetical protein
MLLAAAVEQVTENHVLCPTEKCYHHAKLNKYERQSYLNAEGPEGSATLGWPGFC